MHFICKSCPRQAPSLFTNAKDFVAHFELCHKTSALSRFCCGLESCYIVCSNAVAYNNHLAKFHPLQQNSEVSLTKTYKCIVPNCSFSCSVSSTLRSHRKRHHGQYQNEGESTSKVPLYECDVDFEPNVNDELQCQSPSPPECSTLPPALSLVQRRDHVHEKCSHFYLSLTSKFHVPESTIQFMIESQYSLSKESGAILTEELVEKIARCSIIDSPENFAKFEAAVSSVVANNVFSEVHHPKGEMRTMYMRRKTYHGAATYVSPKPFKLGLNKYNEKRVGHYVDIEKSLESFFEDDSIYEQYTESISESSYDENMISDVSDGSLLKNHPILSQDRSAIGIMLYQDDLELVNAVGSAKGKHKITCVYYTLSNLKRWTRTKINVIRLALLVAEQDVAYFGLKTSMKPLLKQLKKLEINGMVIRGQKVRVVTLMLLGDNLGTHTFIGMVENFSSSKYFCRYCEESRVEWKERWRVTENDECSDSEDEESDSDIDEDSSDDECCDHSQNNDGVCDDWDEEIEETLDIPESHGPTHGPWPLRTPASYDLCLSELQERPGLDSCKGVVAKCHLNKLESFHCVGSCPPCIAHDLFEGVVAHDVALAIKYFISTTTTLTVDIINSKIRSLKMLGSDQGDKPALVTEKMKKLRGNAIQNWNFLRFLPLILHNRINKRDPVYLMVLKLIDVTRTLTSPAIARSHLPALKLNIHKYLQMRVDCFPGVPLRPKHHFMEHYPELIEIFGCLMGVGTLGFESKHRFFKNAAAAKKNFKNITSTLSEEHQLCDSAQSVEHLVSSFPIIESASPFNSICLSPDLKQCLVTYFGEEFLEVSAVSEKVRFRGTYYCKGEAVVTSCSSTYANLCLAELILVNGRSCYIAGQSCRAELKPSLQVFTVHRKSNFTIVNVERLPDYVSYPLYTLMRHEIVVLKHLVVSPN